VIRRGFRYQAAIIENHHILLLRIVEQDGRTFWVPPGGGREEEETAECCVCREVFEEASLAVEVERLLFAVPATPGGMYDARHTYLCQVRGGTLQHHVHPACDATIQEAAWFDLRDPAGWPPLIVRDQITHPWLELVRSTLGYGSTQPTES
jgi:ADP-ribose pyrophosphatase YjhB (NUDIX family)